MQIKIKCPNKDCGKTLVVESDMAGKKGKCSTCDQVFMIPAPPDAKTQPGGSTVDVPATKSGELSSERKKASKSGTRKSSKRRPGSKSGEKFLDDYVEQPKPKRSKGSGVDDFALSEDDFVDYEDYVEYEEPAPRRSRSPQRRDDVYDDYEDDYEDYAPPRARRGRDEYYDDPYDDPYVDDYYEDPYGAPVPGGRSRRRKSGPNLGLIRAGMMIMAVAGCVFCGAIGFKILSELFIILTMESLSGTTETGVTIWKIADLIWVLSSVAVIVGYSFLLLLPNKYNSMGLTIAALSVGAVNLMLQIFLKTVPLLSEKGMAGLFKMLGGSFAASGSRIEAVLKLFLVEGLFIAEMVLVALALMAINKQLKDRYNTQSAKQLIIPAGIYGGVILVVTMFLLILSESPPSSVTAARIWKWVLYLCLQVRNGMLIWYFVGYLLLMFNTRNATPKA